MDWVGKWKKDRILLITPFFSKSVCHASVRSKKFIHIGRIKINTTKLVWFILFEASIIASGYANIRQITVLIKESRRARPSAFKFYGVVILARFDKVNSFLLFVRP